MNLRKIQRNLLLVLILTLPILVAWGPQRELSDYYDTNTYPNHPQINSTENNPLWGFTPDFASIKEADDVNWINGDYVVIKPGTIYMV